MSMHPEDHSDGGCGHPQLFGGWLWPSPALWFFFLIFFFQKKKVKFFSNFDWIQMKVYELLPN
jgi:hypothetical protein